MPKYLIQLGDIRNNDGTGHTSHMNLNEYIEDEISTKVNFSQSGLVAMANKGKYTNGSQFFITLDVLPSLNGKYTIIGSVEQNFELLALLAKECGGIDGVPKCNLKISKTGIYDYKEYQSRRTNKNKL